MNHSYFTKSITFFFLFTCNHFLFSQDHIKNKEDFKFNSPTQISQQRSNYVSRYDSTIDIRLDTITNSWFTYSKRSQTYHANQMIHVQENIYLNELNRMTFNDQGLTTMFERFEKINGIWEPLQQSDYYYNTNNQLIEIIANAYVNGQWMPINSFQTAYNSNGDVIEEFYKFYNGSTWENSSQSTYTYDIYGNVDTTTYYTYQNGPKENQMEIAQIFDGQGNILEKVTSFGQGSQWVPNDKQISTYTSFNSIETRVFYEWVNNNWVKNDSASYIYNALENKTHLFQFSFQNNTWIPSFKQQIFYNSNNQFSSSLNESYINGAFENYSKQNRTYDASGNITLEQTQFWNSSIQDWDNFSKFEMIYTNWPSELQVIFYQGNGTNWNPQTKNDYTYNPQIAEDDILGYPFEGFHDYQFTGNTHYSYLNGTWENVQTESFHYSDIINSVNNASKLDLTVYPNPANDRVFITGDLEASSRIQIFNISGQEVISQNIFGKTAPVVVSQLEQGVYTIRIINKSLSTTRKFIKQ